MNDMTGYLIELMNKKANVTHYVAVVKDDKQKAINQARVHFGDLSAQRLDVHATTIEDGIILIDSSYEIERPQQAVSQNKVDLIKEENWIAHLESTDVSKISSTGLNNYHQALKRHMDEVEKELAKRYPND